MSDHSTVAVPGTGIKGAPMAGRLLDAALAALPHLERASDLGYGQTDLAAIYRGVIKGDPS